MTFQFQIFILLIIVTHQSLAHHRVLCGLGGLPLSVCLELICWFSIAWTPVGCALWITSVRFWLTKKTEKSVCLLQNFSYHIKFRVWTKVERWREFSVTHKHSKVRCWISALCSLIFEKLWTWFPLNYYLNYILISYTKLWTNRVVYKKKHLEKSVKGL